MSNDINEYARPSTSRERDVAVWTAIQIIEQYEDIGIDPYDAIEWLVKNLKDEAFKECAQYYDEKMNEEITLNRK